MTRPYFNGTQVLPHALLREVQRYCHGQLYIPKAINKAAQNRARVLAFKADGLGTREIARRLHLSERGVRKILERERKSQGLPRN